MADINSTIMNAKSDVYIPRTKYLIPNNRLMTASAGHLYPIYCAEVLPGDSCDMFARFLARMQTPLHPTMSDAYIDIAWFYVPARLTWNHWKEFMGESPSDPYLNPTDYTIPKLYIANGASSPEEYGIIPFKTVLDNLGYPAGNSVAEINCLDIRGFSLIWNEFYRDENLQYAIDVPLGDSISTLVQSTGGPQEALYLSQDAEDYYNGNYDNFYINDTALGGVLPPVSKIHDLFTSATLRPQKGEPVPIPNFNADMIPVISSSAINDTSSWPSVSVTGPNNSILPTGYISTRNNSLFSESNSVSEGEIGVRFSNLFANSSAVSYSTIQDLRYALMLQKFTEIDSRFGTRYRESIFSHFRVLTDDLQLQVPEFLGYIRTKVGMNQVIQTSSSTVGSPQGNTAAYSLTSRGINAFNKSFTEHGFLYGVMCIKNENYYMQGLPAHALYETRYDYYWPEFNSVGDQPLRVPLIYNPDFVGQTTPPDYWDEYFGFQENYWQYRYKPNEICGQFRNNHPNSLSYWHYGEYFEEQPILSDGFIRQRRDLIDRTLAGNSIGYDQFLFHFDFEPKWTRTVDANSFPGLRSAL